MNAVVVISLPSFIAGDVTAAWPSNRFVACVGRSLMIFVVYYHRFPVNFTVRNPMPHGHATRLPGEAIRALPVPGGTTTSRRRLKLAPVLHQARRLLPTAWFAWPEQGEPLDSRRPPPRD
ncbi:hypothetical protein [Aromatoleum bremense]|uniref:Secreted protein n=1 Tax=Aromatoleum bremense TaxID=76115 RepID=A0ABX1NY62_9RHOO|nr:hypothetical protein [Aromatoleum bremense]NMG16728.1 hypothetical protein [Aromatoleum bremense]